MALWTPADLAVAPSRWWDAQASSTITKDASNRVSEWRCRVSAYPLTQATTANQPVYQPTGLNGYPTLYQSGDPQTITGVGTNTPTSSSYIICAARTDDTTTTAFRNLFLWGQNGSSTARAISDTNQQNYVGVGNSGAGTQVDAFTFDSTTGSITGFTVNLNGAATGNVKPTIMSNGVSILAPGSLQWSTTANARVQVGRWDSYGNAWVGAYGEFILLGYVPTADEQARLEGYLSWKWGWQDKLPSGHAYRNAAPTTGGGAFLTASAGSFAMTGRAANVLYGHTLPVAPASLNLTGIAANVARKLALAASTAAYALQGIATGLRKSGGSMLPSGAYALTGRDAGVFAVRRLTADRTTYTLQGVPAGLNRVGSYQLAAVTGPIALTGRAANLIMARRFVMAPAAFTLTGRAANMLRSRYLYAGPSTVIMSGKAATLTAGPPGKPVQFDTDRIARFVDVGSRIAVWGTVGNGAGTV